VDIFDMDIRAGCFIIIVIVIVIVIVIIVFKAVRIKRDGGEWRTGKTDLEIVCQGPAGPAGWLVWPAVLRRAVL